MKKSENLREEEKWGGNIFWNQTYKTSPRQHAAMIFKLIHPAETFSSQPPKFNHRRKTFLIHLNVSIIIFMETWKPSQNAHKISRRQNRTTFSNSAKISQNLAAQNSTCLVKLERVNLESSHYRQPHSHTHVIVFVVTREDVDGAGRAVSSKV